MREGELSEREFEVEYSTMNRIYECLNVCVGVYRRASVCVSVWTLINCVHLNKAHVSDQLDENL